MTGIVTSIRLPNKRELIHENYKAPESACRLNDHAHNLSQKGHTIAAVVAARRAVNICPEHPVILVTLGGLLFDVGLFAEAEAVLKKSISIEAEYAPAHGNLGSVLAAQGKYAEAKQAFKQALSIEPDFIDARWNYSMVLLDYGDWTEAWPYYEARREQPGKARAYPKYPYPHWQGEDLNGKTLHVQGEQGIGDRILFSRYLAWIKKTWPQCRIRFLYDAIDLADLSSLMWGYNSIVEFLPNGISFPDDADYGVYLMNIPRIHGSTPDNIPPEPGLIAQNVIKHKNLVKVEAFDSRMMKVGICWTGNTAMKRNGERSIPLEMLLTLEEIPNVVLFGLQYETKDIERLGAGELVYDLTPQIRSMGFPGTAACIYNLDLVITCCTVTSHLAGALGAPCWTLLCANPYWLWGRGRNDSFWYPNHQLFRQTQQGDWKPVIAEVKESLAACAEIHMRDAEKAA